MAVKTKPASVAERLKAGELALFWAPRRIGKRVASRLATWALNERGVMKEHPDRRGDHVQFELNPDLGPGYWLEVPLNERSKDVAEFLAEELAEERLAPDSRYWMVTSLEGWKPPTPAQDNSLKRVI